VDGDTSCNVSVDWLLVTPRAICTNISSTLTVSSVVVVSCVIVPPHSCAMRRPC